MFPGRIWHAYSSCLQNTLAGLEEECCLSALSIRHISLDEFGISSWQSNCLYQSDWSRVSLLIRSGGKRPEGDDA